MAQKTERKNDGNFEFVVNQILTNLTCQRALSRPYSIVLTKQVANKNDNTTTYCSTIS
jgi:hypothetical protein